MERKRQIQCSLCGETDHNKRSCPKKPIEDTYVKDNNYITEEVIIHPKKDHFIRDLLDRDAYDIEIDLFRYWLQDRPILLKELKYVIDKGLSNDSLKLYIELAKDINSYY